MEKKRKIGFATKLLSNHYYLNNVLSALVYSSGALTN
jgi:hypothetical protein